jgi:hypothetical protein
MYDIFQELGLDELVDFSDMKLLHDHVGGHYPTLIDFLKQGNVDRAESELHLLFHTIESQKLADLDDVFSFFDETGDGSISLDEFKLALKKLHVDTKLKDREVETLMRRFAHHGDGEGYHVDGNHIDYSDFLDYFGTGHDFLKAQSTMADIVIYMQQLVAVSKHKEKHSVSLSHSMSVHSPLHLNSVLESNRESSLKFSEFGKILGNINTQMSRVAEDNDDPNKWWSDDSEVAESIAGDKSDRSERIERGVEDRTGAFLGKRTETEEEEEEEEEEEDEEWTRPYIPPRAPESPRFTLSPQNQYEKKQSDNETKDSRTSSPTSTPATTFSTASPAMSPTTSPTSLELAHAMETLEDRLTAKMERAIRFNEAAKKKRQEMENKELENKVLSTRKMII